MRRPFRRSFAGDDRGAITVEFVIWCPILLLWFIGSVAFYDAYRDRGRAEKASHVISDIVSRQVEVSPDFVTSLHDLLDTMLADMPQGKWIRLSSVKYTGGNYFVEWSDATGSGLPMEHEEIPSDDLPVMSDGDTVIIAETYVPYDPILGWNGLSSGTISRVVPIRPRYAPRVVYVADE
jgi:hypothetical protein